MAAPTVTPGAGATASAFDATSPPPEWPAAFTFTARVRGVSKSPSKARVSVAVSAPAAAPATLEIDSPEIAGVPVTSSKRPAPAPAKVVPARVTARVAPSRPASVSGEGLGAATTGVAATVTGNDVVARSPAEASESASLAVMVTVLLPSVDGVPQIRRGSAPGQSPPPSASKTRPEGSPDAV